MTTFDVNRYLGMWYQIAAVPMPYSWGCVNSVANYSLNADGTIKVHNQCYDDNGKLFREAFGTAEITNQQYPFTMAALIVYFSRESMKESFGVDVEYKPEKANYLIHYTDYDTFSVIGSADESSVYILSRYPYISENSYNIILGDLESWGYDTSRIQVDKNRVVKL